MFGKVIIRWQNTLNKGFISEIFSSYQGEGKYVGAKQLFVRLAGCHIDCIDCDTDHHANTHFEMENTQILNPVSPEALAEHILTHYNLSNFHSISITGGEPLEQDGFVQSFVKHFKPNSVQFFLETSGCYAEKLLNIEHLFDILSVDIKLKSVFGVKFDEKLFDVLQSISSEKYYLKLVVGDQVDFNELDTVIQLIQKVDTKSIYIQPHSCLINELLLEKIVDKFAGAGITAYYVPQVHKLIRIR